MKLSHYIGAILVNILAFFMLVAPLLALFNTIIGDNESGSFILLIPFMLFISCQITVFMLYFKHKIIDKI